MKLFYVFCSACLFLIACNNNKTADQPATGDTATASKVIEVPAPSMPDLPASVVYKNWEPGDPQATALIIDVYKAWDTDNPTDMATYFADSSVYDLPDGSRLVTTKETVEATLRKWRGLFKETTNLPFSLISLHNKDFDQDWVIAWTWTRWKNANGTKDSMLFCDNWRLKNNKIEYLNSLEHRASKQLSKSLNKNIPQ
jgi:hypothetical protein